MTFGEAYSLLMVRCPDLQALREIEITFEERLLRRQRKGSLISRDGRLTACSMPRPRGLVANRIGGNRKSAMATKQHAPSSAARFTGLPLGGSQNPKSVE
jgi:hypothetical protein